MLRRLQFAGIASALVAIVSVFMFSLPVLAQADVQAGLCTGANLEFSTDPSGADCSSTVDTTEKINNLIRQVINLLSIIVGVVAVVMIIVGGLKYITSGGSDSNVTGAKNTILYAIIGLIIVALAQVIVRFVLSKVSTATT